MAKNLRQEIAHAHSAQTLFYTHFGFCTALFQAQLEVCTRIAGRRASCSTPAHSDGVLTDSGKARREALSKLSSRPEPRRLVEPDSQPGLVAAADPNLRTDRRSDFRSG